MLGLTRKTGEEIVIDGTTIVRVLSVRGNRVRLGVYAMKPTDASAASFNGGATPRAPGLARRSAAREG